MFPPNSVVSYSCSGAITLCFCHNYLHGIIYCHIQQLGEHGYMIVGVLEIHPPR
jgi:hypothetical protein